MIANTSSAIQNRRPNSLWTGKVGLQCTNGSNLQDIRIHSIRMVSQAWLKFKSVFIFPEATRQHGACGRHQSIQISKTRLLRADPQFTGTRSQPNGYDMFHINAVSCDRCDANGVKPKAIRLHHQMPFKQPSSWVAGFPSQSSVILAARVRSQIGFKAVWGTGKLDCKECGCI